MVRSVSQYALVGLVMAVGLVAGCKGTHHGGGGGGLGYDPLLTSGPPASVCPGVVYEVCKDEVVYTVDSEALNGRATQHWSDNFEQSGKRMKIVPRYGSPAPVQQPVPMSPPVNGSSEKLQPVPEGYRPSSSQKPKTPVTTTEWRRSR